MDPVAPLAASRATLERARAHDPLRRARREQGLATTPVVVKRSYRRRPVWITATLWTLVFAYGVALALIALWPTYVDVPLRPMLDSFTAAAPMWTYARMEFAANVLLFVPFGLLFTLILRRGHYVVLPSAIVVAVAVEASQLFIDERNSTLLDVVANVTGASVGILLAALVRAARR